MFSQLLISREDNTPSQLLLPAIEYIEAHYTDPAISVELWAKLSHVSVTYFRRLFKQLYSVSPKQYIMRARINKARELLRSSHYTISAIASDCGFGSECHFCRTFKDYVGCSPSEYRNRTSMFL